MNEPSRCFPVLKANFALCKFIMQLIRYGTCVIIARNKRSRSKHIKLKNYSRTTQGESILIDLMSLSPEKDLVDLNGICIFFLLFL